MISAFNKFKGVEILNFFLDYPNSELNINDLAKKLKISTRTAKEYIDLLLEYNILFDKNIRNNKLVVLNNDDKLVTELKKVRVLSLVKELKLEKEINNPFYIFGSCASGEYYEESDLDIFIIKQKNYNKNKVLALASKIRLEVNIKEVPFYKLLEYKDKNKEFIIEVKGGIYFGEPLHGL